MCVINNEKGESLVEIVVSMVILVTIVLSASTMVMYSTRASTGSLEYIENVNKDALDIETNSFDISELDEFSVKIDISFRMTEDVSYILRPRTDYNISDNQQAVMTKNGLIFFNFEI